MKKLFMACGVCAMLFSATACNKSNAAGNEDAAFNDSIAELAGKVIGSEIAGGLGQSMTPEQLKKDAYIRGMQVAIMADTSDIAYLQGLRAGVNLAQNFDAMAKQGGIDIDRNVFMASFKKAFLADSVNSDELSANNMALQLMMQRAQQRSEERRKAELENAPEAKANREAGEKFIADLKAKDPSIKTTESGLSYKVITEGAGDSITDTDRVAVIYKGELTDGTVFDDSKGEARTFSPRSVVPGFGEGLKLMKKGAKYILYIPGDLAYGVEGQPYAKIGPNQTLVFTVEVAGVNETPKK